MKAEALLNHSMMVMSPFEAFGCSRRPSKGSRESSNLKGKDSGILASKGRSCVRY